MPKAASTQEKPLVDLESLRRLKVSKYIKKLKRNRRKDSQRRSDFIDRYGHDGTYDMFIGGSSFWWILESSFGFVGHGKYRYEMRNDFMWQILFYGEEEY
jgi:hypothetical protein